MTITVETVIILVLVLLLIVSHTALLLTLFARKIEPKNEFAHMILKQQHDTIVGQEAQIKLLTDLLATIQSERPVMDDGQDVINDAHACAQDPRTRETPAEDKLADGLLGALID